MLIEPAGEMFPISTVINVMFLTTSGLQLASLLPYDDEAGLRSIAQDLALHQAVKQIELLCLDGPKISFVHLLFRREGL